MNATIAEVRSAVNAIETDVNDANNTVSFPGAVIASQRLSAAVAKLVVQVGHEWGESSPS